MAKTTNILDLNNRLEKVEKENVAQNSYTSLKNKPKINNVTLTGNKTSSDLGLANTSDIVGLQSEIDDLIELTTDTNYVDVTADGVKTRANLLSELFALVDLDKITKQSTFVQIGTAGDIAYYHCSTKSTNNIAFSRSVVVENVGLSVRTNTLASSSNSFDSVSGTMTDNSSAIVESGTKYRIIY